MVGQLLEGAVGVHQRVPWGARFPACASWCSCLIMGDDASQARPVATISTWSNPWARFARVKSPTIALDVGEAARSRATPPGRATR